MKNSTLIIIISALISFLIGYRLVDFMVERLPEKENENG